MPLSARLKACTTMSVSLQGFCFKGYWLLLCWAQVETPDGAGVRALSVEGTCISGRSCNGGVHVKEESGVLYL